MRTPRLATLLVVLLVGLMLAPPTLAQQGGARAIKSLLRKGNRAFATGDYPAAYDAFRQGYELSPKNPVFLRSMAYSLLKMYQHEKARKRIQQYIKAYPRAKDRNKMRGIVSGLEVVVKTKIAVQSTPPGAALFIDAEAAGRVGKTPYKGTIHPGKHSLILKRDGYYITIKDFEIKPKQSLIFKVPLQVPLKISTLPPGATIHLGGPDGKSLGTAPFSGGISPGKIKLWFKLKGYQPLRKAVSVVGGKPAQVEAELLVGLKVTSDPAGATVVLGGRKLGRTPLTAAVPPAKHTVVLKLAGFTDVKRQVAAAPGGQPSALHVKLRGGLLSMRTSVTGARVTVGQIKVGTTPVGSATVPLGKQLIKVEHASRRQWSRAVEFTPGELVKAEVKMGHPMWPVWVSAGVSAAGLALGTVTGVMALSHVGDSNDANLCARDGTALTDGAQCGFGLQNASTAGFVTGGVAAAVALVYYLVWARPSATVSRSPIKSAALRR